MYPGNTYIDKALGADQIRMNGRFDANGSGAVTNTYGKGFTVSRTGTGLYKVLLGGATWPTPFKRLLGFSHGAITADGTLARIKVITDASSSATAPAITLESTDSSGNAADVTATIFFEFVFGTSELNS